MLNFREEVDGFGSIKVLEEVYWGAQTQRSLKYFNIGEEKIPSRLIYSLALLKKTAALVNKDMGILDEEIATQIAEAADKIMSNEYYNNFPLSVWQTGSGTQTNMNMNEVIANMANEAMGHKKGGKYPVHPNDHVNKGQSSNDSFPTAMNVAASLTINYELLPSLKNLLKEFKEKAELWKDKIKIGRTHLQDATPITLGQEFSAFAFTIENAILRIEKVLPEISFLAQGATAVGTGLNCKKGFAEKFAALISQYTNIQFQTASNKFTAISTHDGLVNLSGALNTTAAGLMKIANDIRLLGSGPRCGIGEIILPQNEPGSSIMPGKVNPTQCEAMTMICAQVMGNHTTISIAGSNGQFQLNVFKPVIIYNLLQSINLLTDGCKSFAINCVAGITANDNMISHYLEQSLMLVTALNSKIGYDDAAKIAKKAYAENLSLRKAAIELNLVSEEEFDSIVQPSKMISPYE